MIQLADIALLQMMNNSTKANNNSFIFYGDLNTNNFNVWNNSLLKALLENDEDKLYQSLVRLYKNKLIEDILYDDIFYEETFHFGVFCISELGEEVLNYSR